MYFMPNEFKTIQDVVDWNLCIGCGACYSVCEKEAISLTNIVYQGIRPVVDRNKCAEDCTCLSVCPAIGIDANLIPKIPEEKDVGDILFGPALEIWVGHAADPEIHKSASSGGATSALALYCLEKEKMESTLHSEMDPEDPSINRTVVSKTKQDLLKRTGSRYAPASPCDSIDLIEESANPCVFVGKPCDTAAMTLARKQRSKLDENLGLVLTFFCAGAPSAQGTLAILGKLEIEASSVTEVRYRGNGWPGKFNVKYDDNHQKSLTYMESWGELQKYRSFRCHVCPDGLGQIADISCGDAWHLFKDDENPGMSLIIVRTERGREILHRAIEAGYLKVTPTDAAAVISAQGLVNRKPQIYGRLIAMRLLSRPIPRFIGFSLKELWMNFHFLEQMKIILGTTRRLIKKKLWHRNPIAINSIDHV
jgi:coenzyme F420 hydrogenase subunit beta